jgi:hypothetical protein
MIDVTVLLLEGGLPSTSMAPLEIFACAGSLWGLLMGTPTAPRFRVRTATIDGRKTRNFVPVTLQPSVSLAEVRRTDLVVVPTAGMDLEVARTRNAGVIEWLAHRRGGKTAVAGVYGRRTSWRRPASRRATRDEAHGAKTVRGSTRTCCGTRSAS